MNNINGILTLIICGLVVMLDVFLVIPSWGGAASFFGIMGTVGFSLTGINVMYRMKKKEKIVNSYPILTALVAIFFHLIIPAILVTMQFNRSINP
jgi:hypothetical protein